MHRKREVIHLLLAEVFVKPFALTEKRLIKIWFTSTTPLKVNDVSNDLLHSRIFYLYRAIS
eukprot:snap_masked-scaffold_14-processed-gene-1.19-mRNA-1 protein AED:1.00 eAED:1.00 QI:0/0/0/0/1/1/2/0/60